MTESADHAKRMTITWDEWCRRLIAGRYAGTTYKRTEGYKAGAALYNETHPTPPPPTPPPARPPSTSTTAQRVVFFANVTPDAVQHFCRLNMTWKAALTADPAYTPTANLVDTLKAHGTVYAWGNQEQIPEAKIASFETQWGLHGRILQAETPAEFDSAWRNPLLIGNPNAWTPAQRDLATAQANAGKLAVIGEVYEINPGYSSQGVPLASACYGVAMDDGVHYPLGDYYRQMPVGMNQGAGVWHAAGLQPEDWQRMEAIG